MASPTDSLKSGKLELPRPSPEKRRSLASLRTGSAGFNNLPSEIINLNVGGQAMATSRQTLTSIPDTFFTALLSGRIPSLRDATGAYFIDRDPQLFSIILNYLRTRQLNLDSCNVEALKHEAEFYGIMPLVKRIELCYEMLDTNSSCGDVIFQAHLKTIPPAAIADDERMPSTSKIHNYEQGFLNPVVQVLAHHNAIAVAHQHYVTCYRFKDSFGWQCIFRSEYIEKPITEMAFCYNCNVGPGIGGKLMIGLAQENEQHIRLWSINLVANNSGDIEATKIEIGRFQLKKCKINALFFIGTQLVALGCKEGRVGVYHSTSNHWLVQDLGQLKNQAISAYDKAGCNFLILGSKLGSINLIDMQKFPLRMKDGDLLINELYEDPEQEEITAISCYLTRTPKTNGNWLEIAYGTASGTVRVLVQHPETVGHGPQLFQTFKVHLHGISRVMLSEKFLISMCDKMHVRTWTLTRFRGRISTQPGSTPHASFRIMKIDESQLEEYRDNLERSTSMLSIYESIDLRPADIGPFGDQDDGDRQIFVEKLRAYTDKLGVIMSSNGQRICDIKSVDGSIITSYCVHECEAVAMGNRSKRYIMTGHSNGHIQVWDLTTGFAQYELSSGKSVGSRAKLPSCEDLLKATLV